MNEKFVLKTSAFEDVMVSGVDPVERLISKVTASIDHCCNNGPNGKNLSRSEQVPKKTEAIHGDQ